MDESASDPPPDDEEDQFADREPGVPPPANDDLTGYDEALAESFPASDPPQLY